MKNNLRSLLSVPALAIAAMAVSATAVNAQCPGGCFGYPTPSQPSYQSFTPAFQTYTPAYRSYAPAVEYQSFQVEPMQTFVQPEVFAAPQYVPAPVEQTFVSQPAMIESAPIIGAPQATYSTLPADAYSVQPQSMLPMQSAPMQTEPMQAESMQSEPMQAVSPSEQALPMSEGVDGSMEAKQQDGVENVEEGQIEGEIISPADDEPASSVMKQDEPIAPVADVSDEAEQAEMKKAAKQKPAMDHAAEPKVSKEKPVEPIAPVADVSDETEKAEMKKTAKQKPAMDHAAEPKMSKEKPVKTSNAELSNEERVVKLEASLKRQVMRAEQASKRNLSKKLTELKAADASFADIETAEQESAAALKERLAAIQKRIQARIEQLKK